MKGGQTVKLACLRLNRSGSYSPKLASKRFERGSHPTFSATPISSTSDLIHCLRESLFDIFDRKV